MSTRSPWLLFLLALTTGCESGTYRQLEVTLPDAVTAAHDAEAPGVLVSDLWPGVPLRALCGQAEPKALIFGRDDLFSCMPDAAEQTVRVWVDPAPRGWNREELCSAPSGELGLTYGGERTVGSTGDTGLSPRAPVLELAEGPEAGWAQGRTVGTWRRDGSPCGGRLEVEVAVSAP